ncbi:MAG: hypothetical protein DMF79_01900 [Acidobacteria bacterium]|nr:MAG: hypothetical protein DMF79_01900 [Acidobacteriota bacterium]
MTDRPPRLDDYCPRCRLLMNHDVASLFDGAVAKVTCRTCHNTHDYRHAQVPAKRKAKNEKVNLIEQVLAGMPRPPDPPPPPPAPLKKKRDLWAEVERLKKK